MSFVRPILFRAAALGGVLLAVLFLLVISLGATGVSDKLLQAQVSEQIRGLREPLSRTIKDPDELERALQARRADLESFYGLDTPWYQRMPSTVVRVLKLDLGNARTLRTTTGETAISSIIWERIPNTLMLFLTSFVIVAGIALLVGVRFAANVGSRIDRILSYFSAISFAMPTWWVGILGILVLSYKLGILPTGRMYSTPPPVDALPRLFDLAKHAILPVSTLVLVSIGPAIYSVRTMTMTVAQEDHVTIARAKGMPESVIGRRHILRVAAPPIVTGLILGLTSTVGGSILVETIFQWRGMGGLYYEALTGSPDEGLIIALTYVFTLMYVVARLVLEVLYVVLDPRVRYT